MSALSTAERWLYQRLEQAQQEALAQDATFVVVRIHNEAVPQDYLTNDPPPPNERPYWPCIVFRLLAAGSDSMGSNGHVFRANPIYLVEAIHRRGSFDGLNTYVDLMFAALHRQSGTVSSGRVVECIRQREFKRLEHDSGIPFQRLGAEYRLGVTE